MCAKSFHSYPILCDPVDWSSRGSSIHKVKVNQLCPILCNPHGLYHPWNSLGQNTGVGSLSLLQGIFPTQGSNLGLGFFTSWVSRAWHIQKKKEKKQGECGWKEQLWGRLLARFSEKLPFELRLKEQSLVMKKPDWEVFQAKATPNTNP